MPSQTFFNLPDEKKQRLLEAARYEFASVPFETVSINQIIQRAKISRGSFYMYFSGKSDLYFYLMKDLFHSLKQEIFASLQNSGGDLFILCEDLFDQISDFLSDTEVKSLLKNAHDFIHSLHVGGVSNPRREGHGREKILHFLPEIVTYIDTKQLRVKDTHDLEELILLLMQMLERYLSQFLFQEISLEEAKKRLSQTLDWLKFGVYQSNETKKEEYCAATT